MVITAERVSRVSVAVYWLVDNDSLSKGWMADEAATAGCCTADKKDLKEQKLCFLNILMAMSSSQSSASTLRNFFLHHQTDNDRVLPNGSHCCGCWESCLLVTVALLLLRRNRCRLSPQFFSYLEQTNSNTCDTSWQLGSSKLRTDVPPTLPCPPSPSLYQNIDFCVRDGNLIGRTKGIPVRKKEILKWERSKKRNKN